MKDQVLVYETGFPARSPACHKRQWFLL